jgi:Uma2 family endonuclease
MLAQHVKRDVPIEEYFEFVWNHPCNGFRYELIDGEIVPMSPEGSHHYAHIGKIQEILFKIIVKEIYIYSQGALKLDARKIVLPDIALLRRRQDFYKNALPGPKDTYLIIEVAHSSLSYDQGQKLALYAEASIPEVWVFDVENEVLHVYRKPVDGQYEQQMSLIAGDKIAMLAFPDLLISVSDFIP